MNSAQRRRKRKRRMAERAAKMRSKIPGCLDYERIVSPEALLDAAYICQKSVMWKGCVQNFMLLAVRNCTVLSRELMEGTYRKKPANHFILNERGKRRLISGVYFRDRVVQRSYCDNFLIPVLCYGIVLDNSASQLGKGTEFARKRFALHMERAYRRYGAQGWFFHYDFKDYFHSISPARAMDFIAEKADRLVTSAKDAANLERLLALGREFVCEEDGLGLGNQTSQTIALAYASPIDHAICEIGGWGLSGRYMDDGYGYCASRDEAALALGLIEEHARRLGLKLHANKTGIEPLMHEHSFLKTVYRLRSDGTAESTVSADTLRRYRRHYTSLARRVNVGTLPETVLDASEGSFKGIAIRASNLDECVQKMKAFQEKTRSRLAPCNEWHLPEPDRWGI